ncbi:MAG: TolB family protein, partial [Planctomycetota bacterium]
MIRTKYSIIIIITLFCFCADDTLAKYIDPGAKLTKITDNGKSTLLACSPDGRKILYLYEISGSQKQLMVVNADGTNPQAISLVGNPIFAEWSYHSDKVAYIFSNSDSLESQTLYYLYDISTNKTTTISSPYTQQDIDLDDGPIFSPDDKFIAYALKPASTNKRQLWVVDVATGDRWHLLPDRGGVKDIQWSLALPYRIAMKLGSTNEFYDIATVDPYGKDLKLITNIGAQSIYILRPALSPDGKLIVYGDSTEMTQEERDLHHEDIFIANQDGTNKVNITKASTPSTERRLNFTKFTWSWDSELILTRGNRYDKLGNAIGSLFMVDPFKYTYETMFTSNPKETGILDDLNAMKWSYDNSKIAILKVREEVQNWGVERSITNKYWTVCLYQVKEKKYVDLLIFDQELDRKVIPGYTNRQLIEGFSWMPDNRSLLITIADVISTKDGQTKPDIYRLDLPPELISPDADKYVGPPNIRKSTGFNISMETIAEKNEQVSPSPYANGDRINSSSLVTEIIEPTHMTVAEAIESLPSLYEQYITLNTSRNIILFKGPLDILNEMKSDLDLVDTDPPHILVDLLAVELSEEANRNLGLDWSYAEG